MILRVMFKCVLMAHGDMCVITIGTLMMLKWSAHNLVTPHQVSKLHKVFMNLCIHEVYEC